MSPNPKELEEKLDPPVKRTYSQILQAFGEFLSRLHSNCAQPHPQFESLVERTIKKQIFELLSQWLDQSKSRIPTEILATVAGCAI